MNKKQTAQHGKCIMKNMKDHIAKQAGCFIELRLMQVAF